MFRSFTEVRSLTLIMFLVGSMRSINKSCTPEAESVGLRLSKLYYIQKTRATHQKRRWSLDCASCTTYRRVEPPTKRRGGA